jgi:hypothetical protein
MRKTTIQLRQTLIKNVELYHTYFYDAFKHKIQRENNEYIPLTDDIFYNRPYLIFIAMLPPLIVRTIITSSNDFIQKLSDHDNV